MLVALQAVHTLQAVAERVVWSLQPINLEQPASRWWLVVVAHRLPQVVATRWPETTVPTASLDHSLPRVAGVEAHTPILIEPPRPVGQVVAAHATLQPEARRITAHRVAMAGLGAALIAPEPVEEARAQREAQSCRKLPDARVATGALGSTGRHMRAAAVAAITTQARHRVAQREEPAAAVLGVPDTTRRQSATLLVRQGLQTPAVEAEGHTATPHTWHPARAAPAS